MKVAKASAPNSAALRLRPRRRAIPTIAPHGAGEREKLDKADVPVAVAQDHRGHGLDLGDRRECVDPVVRNIEHVRDGVLLLPERSPRQVVEQRVRQALREREADEEQVEMHGDRESRQRGDGPVVESVAQKCATRARGGLGRSHRSHRTSARTNAAAMTAITASRVSARAGERASETTTISVVARR